MLSFAGGQTYAAGDIIARIDEARMSHAIEGITLLGGEPFAHAAAALGLAQAAHDRGLSVMIFSGFTLEQLREHNSLEVKRLLDTTDILVDGPYMRELPETARRWIGSSNQRIHFLSDRYSPSDACWRQRNTLELRLDGQGLSVNGFPSAANREFWRRTR
jgi:anaerobic ribonucleoside-triphosphate reductase activating protein